MNKFTRLIPLLLISFLSLTASAQGLKVNVVGKGSPMILIPGLTCDGAVYDETVKKYQSKYECHVMTLPGFAGNPAIAFEDNFIETVKDLVLEYINSNNIKNPTIVGHSLGGFIALSLAIDHPKDFDKLVIVDSLPFLTAIQVPAATAESAKPFAENMKNMMLSGQGNNEAMQRMMLQSMINDPKDIETALQWGAASDPATVAQAMYELYTTDLREDISKIESPILVMGAWIAYKDYGSTRESTLAIYEGQYTKAPNCTVKMTDTGKHFIMWDDPEFYFASIDSFLSAAE